MNRKLSRFVDKIISKSESKLGLAVMQKVFNTGIPFNIPHKFKFLEITNECTQLLIPDIRANRNHLGGIHACAIATLGEYASGLTLIKKFGNSKYRLIMEDIRVHYIKQGIGALTTEVTLEADEAQRIQKEIVDNNETHISFIANICNANDEIVAVVESNWQLKGWSSVTFKG